MVDLKGQYAKIHEKIDSAVLKVIRDGHFVNGPEVGSFTKDLSHYLNGAHVIPCANGTDALQVAMMALGLKPGDEVIVPAFTYVATAEVIGLLQLTPVMVDVDPYSYNMTVEHIKAAVTSKTKAIVPVHLFGQCADMEPILTFAKEKGLYVIEDTAQAIGAVYTFSDGRKMQAGTMGHIGCTSFFPSKNLGCYGDGGAIYTMDAELATRIKMVANHGQEKKYYYQYGGVNSRLDTIQAAVLNVKMKVFADECLKRDEAGLRYSNLLKDKSYLITPKIRSENKSVYAQYCLREVDEVYKHTKWIKYT